MSYKQLADAIIKQSLVDLWDTSHREESRDFFNGDGFRIYARISKLDRSPAKKRMSGGCYKEKGNKPDCNRIL